MKEIISFYNSLKNKFHELTIVKWYKRTLYKPFKFIASAISWAIFCILIICAILLINYYIQMKNYAENGVGYEPTYSLYTIISGSMYPTIEVYDVVVVFDVDDPSEIEVGDVLTYNSSEFMEGQTITVTHRVVEITVDKDGNYTYYTKGDNNLSVDANGVSVNQILGVVGFKIPQLGRLQFFLASEIGWLLVIVLPALFIIIKYIVQLFNLSKIFSKIPKDSFLFPLFNKPLMLPYNEIPKEIEFIKEEIDIDKTLILDTSDIKRSLIENYPNVISTNIEEKHEEIKVIENSIPEKEPIKSKKVVEESIIEKEEINLDIDNIFEDLQNLTKK